MAIKQTIRREWARFDLLDRQLIKLSVAALLLMVGQWLFTPSFEIAWPVLLAIAVALAGRPAAGVLRRRDSKNTGEQR